MVSMIARWLPDPATQRRRRYSDGCRDQEMVEGEPDPRAKAPSKATLEDLEASLVSFSKSGYVCGWI